MPSLTIRNLDEPLKRRLRLRAAAGNRSMEEEARQILRSALAEPVPQSQDLGERIHALFAPLGGVELAIPPREPMRTPPSFDAPSFDEPSARRRRSAAVKKSPSRGRGAKA